MLNPNQVVQVHQKQNQIKTKKKHLDKVKQSIAMKSQPKQRRNRVTKKKKKYRKDIKTEQKTSQLFQHL